MKKYAVVGEKLAHTMSPIIHQLFFDKKNIEASYDVVEIPKGDFANCRKILLGYDGVNVTVPYKQEIIKYLDEIDDGAMQIGAVNTIVNRNGKLCGFNTDVFGFKFLLEDNGFDCKDKSVAVLGSGGASKAIVFCLLKMRAKEIFIVSRDVVKAEKDYDDNFCKQDKSAVKKDCCDDFDKQDKSADKKYNYTSKCCLENCNLNDNGSVDLTTLKFVGYEQLEKMSGFLIVNTTPIGMFPNDGKSPIAENITKNFKAVCDIVYNPSVTKLCFDAVNNCDKNCVGVCNGLSMLVAQAIGSQQIWGNGQAEKSLICDIFNEIQIEYLTEKNNIIFLSGMMGCGKSFVGASLAKKLDMEFVDLDQHIVKVTGKTVKELFESGEVFFRSCETKSLLDIATNSKDTVVALGGGAILGAVNRCVIKMTGVTIFLDRTLDNIKKTIDIESRPLIRNNVNMIDKIYFDRIELYKNNCNFVVENNATIDDCVEAICRVLKK